jgi:sporulation protein YlmC with PRC-barrel domain
MRTLLTTTALVALLTASAFAQDAATTAGPSDMLNQGYDVVDTDGLASRLLGFPVYSSPASDAEQLGEINDIVIGESGEVSAVILGVGGFLGVGEKNVAVAYDDLDWVTAEDNSERIVLSATKEALEAAADVELVEDDTTDTATAPAADQPADAMAPADNATDTAAAPAADQPADAMAPTDNATETAAAPAADQPADAMAPDNNATETAATDDANADGTDDNLETGAIDPNAPAAAPVAPFDPANATDFDETALTAEELIGTNVYGPDNQHIGTIGDLVLAEDGNIDALIIDFGGFLGIGVKEVAVGFDDLSFYADANNNRSLVLNVTREQMDQAVAFNRDTWEAERDTQRMTVSQL